MNDFEIVGTRGFFHPHGQMNYKQAAELVATAMKKARALGLADLVVNVLGLSGFEPLEIFKRYDVAMRWVESAGAAMRVAWVLKPDLIDFQKIGVMMAQNRGADGDVFPTETEALAWLDARGTSDSCSRPVGDLFRGD